MLILKRHKIKPTPENIAAVRTALRGVTGIYKPPSDSTTKLAELLMKALDRDGWDGLMVFDLPPFKMYADFSADVYGEPTIPLAAVEALHAFYCEQTGTPNASMARHGGKRDAEGRRDDAPALRFVTEALQTRNPKITVKAVADVWDGRKSKGRKAG